MRVRNEREAHSAFMGTVAQQEAQRRYRRHPPPQRSWFAAMRHFLLGGQ